MFITRTSCCKTTHADGYHGAWPGWAVSVSVLPLTLGALCCLSWFLPYTLPSPEGCLFIKLSTKYPNLSVPTLSCWNMTDVEGDKVYDG